MWDRLRPFARFLARETPAGFTVGAILAVVAVVVGLAIAIAGGNDGRIVLFGILLAGLGAGMVVAGLVLGR